jgi:hypothetical protein
MHVYDVRPRKDRRGDLSPKKDAKGGFGGSIAPDRCLLGHPKVNYEAATEFRP